MKRSIERDLQLWKDDSRRKPLLLRGARQVGKTFIIEKFSRQFSSFVEVNFEKRPDLLACFQSLEPKKILRSIEIAMNCSIIPGETLLFLDEIQECPKAIMAFRYFKEELPSLHLVGAGSLLEFVLNDTEFRMPVGRVQFLYLSPLSFFEFLDASGHEKLRQYLQTVDLAHPVEEVFHEQLLSLVRQYMVLGGMPAVLDDYFATESYQHCQGVQTDLLATYRGDFGKYAKTAHHKYLQLLFQRAPGLITQWFKYSKVDPDIPSRELKRALSQLCDAGLLHLVYASSAQGVPLISTVNEKKFKILFLDIGLVHRAMRMSIDALMQEDLLLVNRGAMAEQFVGQQLLTVLNPREKGRLYFWVREAKSSSSEVDYVMNIDSRIVPIEVKAGATGRLRSLHRFLDEKGIDFGVRVSQAPLSLEKNILSVPFYLIEELPRLVRQPYQ